MKTYSTSDLCDAHGESMSVADAVFTDFGGRKAFHGSIATIKVDHAFIPTRDLLKTPGQDRVLVIDGGASLEAALLGDRLAAMALDNGWAGIVVNGCVRDAARLALLDIGIKALATCPRRPGQSDRSELDVPVSFAGITFQPGEFVYADQDGIVTSPMHRPPESE